MNEKFDAAHLEAYLVADSGKLLTRVQDLKVPEVAASAVVAEVLAVLNRALARLHFQEQTEKPGSDRGQFTVMKLVFGDCTNAVALSSGWGDPTKYMSPVPRIVAEALRGLGARLTFESCSDGVTMMLDRS